MNVVGPDPCDVGGITAGFDGVPVKNSIIDGPDRPGHGLDFRVQAAKTHLSEGMPASS